MGAAKQAAWDRVTGLWMYPGWGWQEVFHKPAVEGVSYNNIRARLTREMLMLKRPEIAPLSPRATHDNPWSRKQNLKSSNPSRRNNDR